MSRDLRVVITGDTRSLERAYSRAGKATSSFGSRLKSVAGPALLGFGAAALGAGAKMISMASDAAEVDSKMQVTFGRQLPGLKKNLDTFAEATGASRYQLRQQAADLGALLRPLTANQAETAKMSAEFVKLATDLGSFNNVPTDEALESIRAGLVGEAEPLRRFGVLLNEAAVKAEGLRLGLVKGKEEMTEQEKVQARASLIMKQTALAQGDATRTAGSMANQMKELRNRVSDAATEIGMKLMPVALQLVTWINDNMPRIEAAIGEAAQAIGDGLEIARAAFERLQPHIEAALRIIEGFVQVVKGILTGDWGLVWEGVKNVVGGAVDAIRAQLGLLKAGIAHFAATALEPFKAAFSAAKNWAGARVDDIVTFFSNLPGRIAGTLEALAETALNPFRAAFTAARNWVGARVDDIAGFFTKLPGRVAATLVPLIENALDPFRAAFRAAASAIVEAWEEVVDVLELVKDGVKWLGTKAGAMLEAGVDAITKVANTIAKAFGPLRDVLGAIVGAVRWLIENIPKIPTPSLPSLPDVPGIPGLAEGGIVTRPTLALIGEAGPEAVVPLRESGRLGPLGGPNITINLNGTVLGADKRRIAEEIALEVDAALRRHTRGGGRLAALTT